MKLNKSSFGIFLLSILFLASCTNARYGSMTRRVKSKHTVSEKQTKKKRVVKETMVKTEFKVFEEQHAQPKVAEKKSKDSQVKVASLSKDNALIVEDENWSNEGENVRVGLKNRLESVSQQVVPTIKELPLKQQQRLQRSVEKIKAVQRIDRSKGDLESTLKIILIVLLVLVLLSFIIDIIPNIISFLFTLLLIGVLVWLILYLLG